MSGTTNGWLKKPAPYLIALSLVFFIFLAWFSSDLATDFRNAMKHRLLGELVQTNMVDSVETVDVVYILGGNQSSLRYKYRTVSQLFKRGICSRIWILHRQGITEYNPELQRNLTNDEWSLKTLRSYGVPEKNVRIITVSDGFFGTFSEAKGVASLLEGKDYKSILLISSPYHTNRIMKSFSYTLRDRNIKILSLGTKENVYLRNMVVEFLKLKIYEFFLMKTS
jgi:uncharacterized SAM-binding protein YcdF (DUF218 family)